MSENQNEPNREPQGENQSIVGENQNEPIQEPQGETQPQYKAPEFIAEQEVAAQTQEQTETGIVSEAPLTPPPVKKKKLKKVLIPTAIIAFLAIVGVVVYFLFFSTGNLYQATTNSLKASLSKYTDKGASEVVGKAVKGGSVELSAKQGSSSDISVEAFFNSNGVFFDASGKNEGVDIGTIKAFFTKQNVAVLASNFLGKDGIGVSFENFDEMFDASVFGEKSGSSYSVDEETAAVIKNAVASLVKTNETFSYKDIFEKNSLIEKSSQKIMVGGVDNVSATAVTITVTKDNLLAMIKEFAEKTGVSTEELVNSFDMVPADLKITVTTYINGSGEAMRLEAYVETSGVKPFKLIADFGEKPGYYTKATVSAYVMGTQIFTLERDAVQENTLNTVTLKMTAAMLTSTLKFSHDTSSGAFTISVDGGAAETVIKGTMKNDGKTLSLAFEPAEDGTQVQISVNSQKTFPEKFDYKDVLKMSEEEVNNLQSTLEAYAALSGAMTGLEDVTGEL